MISNYTLLNTAYIILNEDPDLDGVPVTMSEPINDLDSINRWIGIYPGDTEITPGTLGGPWDHEVQFRVVAQMAGLVHGGRVEQLMDDFVSAIITRIVEQREAFATAGVMDLMSSIKRSPGIREDDDGTVRFREDTIVFTGTVRAA